jgi:hypothetical protein
MVLVVAVEPARGRLLGILRRLGVRGLGVSDLRDALALLDVLDADVLLVRGEGDAETLARLRERLPVVMLDDDAAVERAVVEVLRGHGQLAESADLN